MLSGADFTPGNMIKEITLSPAADYEFTLAAHCRDYGLELRAVLTAETGDEIFNHDIGWFSHLPYTEFVFPFTTGTARNYRLALTITAEKHPAPPSLQFLTIRPLTPASEKRQFAYTHSIMQKFEPRQPVLEKWETDMLKLSGGTNEITAALFGFQTAEKGKINATIAGFPDDWFELRNISGTMLPPARPRLAAAGERLGWWLTFTPPAGMKPGNYSGQLKFSGGYAIALELEILDYELPEPDITFLQYHSERYIPAQYLNDDLRLAYYEDMRKHGMNSVTVYNNPDVDGKQIDFQHNWQFSPEELALRKERNCAGTDKESASNWRKRFEFGLEREMELLHRSGLATRKHPVLWLAGKIGYSSDRNDWWGGIEPESVKKIMRQWPKKWASPLYYVIDEPTGYQDRTRKALELLENLRKSDCRIKTVSANIDAEPLGKYYNTWIQGVHRIGHEMTDSCRKHHAELWSYCCSVANDNVAMPRAMFGFWAIRSGVRGVVQWAYYDARDAFCANNKQNVTDRSRCRLSRVGLSPDGPVPTVSWEATREGVTDYRLALLFRQLQEKLQQSIPDPRAKFLLDSGEKIWNQVIDSIPGNAFAPLGGNGSFADRNQFIPQLGFGEPATVFERKRLALRHHIMEVKQFFRRK